MDRSYLTPSNPLGTASAAENIRGGVLLLHQLLAAPVDSYALTAAGYFQGLASVKRYGMYREYAAVRGRRAGLAATPRGLIQQPLM